MRPLHDQEIEDAYKRLSGFGRNADDFSFDVAFMEPDPDGGGMFTVRYEVTAANGATARNASYIGGIGLDWVDAFEQDLRDGAFD